MKICDLNIKLFLIYLIFTNGWAAQNEKIVVICSVVFSWVVVPTTTTTTTTLLFETNKSSNYIASQHGRFLFDYWRKHE